MGVTALLYLGPLLAGLGGAGWGSVLAFAVVFILWLLVLRPQQWPGTAAEWRTAPALIQALTQALMQLVLVTLLFTIGRAIGGALGLRPLWPEHLPLVLSFVSIPLGRLIWDPRKAAQTDLFLDHALEQIGASAQSLPKANRIAEAMAMLAAMPPDLPPDQMIQHFRAMQGAQGPQALWQALLVPGDRERHRALTIFATEGGLIKALGGDIPTKAWAILPNDPDLLSLYAARGLAALDRDPDLWGQFPNRGLLNQRLQAMTGTLAEAPLQALIAACDHLDAARP